MNRLTVATHNQKLEIWIERIRACRSSGMTVTGWCVANNIGNKSYYYWMQKIKQEAFDSLPLDRKSRVSLNPLTSAFAEVPIPKPTPSETIRVHLAQAVIDIPDSVSGSTIAEVLHAVIPVTSIPMRTKDMKKCAVLQDVIQKIILFIKQNHVPYVREA